MANMIQIMQKASQMKQKMQEMQARARLMEVTGEAGHGMVTCTATGSFELKTLKVDASLLKPSDVEVMEDLIVAAVNDARKKAEKLMGEETQKIMAELGIPAGAGLPF